MRPQLELAVKSDRQRNRPVLQALFSPLLMNKYRDKTALDNESCPDKRAALFHS
jgi:hypothetical protein